MSERRVNMPFKRALGTLVPLVLLLLLSCVGARATTVTATVTDTGGQAWANGTWSATLVTTPGFFPPQNGYLISGTTTPVPNQNGIGGNLDNSGVFTTTLTAQALIAPAGSAWRVQVCPAATSPCFIASVIVVGSSQNISSVLVPPAITINMSEPHTRVAAYADIELTNSLPGQFYFNLTSQAPRICIALPCTGANWQPFAGGGGNISGLISLGQIASGSGVNTITGSNIIDASKFASVQAAVTAACAVGGVVLVPQGTYTGPTTFCSNLTIKAFNYGYFGTPTVFTYSSPLSMANLHNIDIEGIKFDFGSAQALTLSSISASRMDFEVTTTDKTAPAVTMTCTNGGGNLAFNQFMRIVTTGGSEGIIFSGLGGPTPTCAITENQFGFLQAFAPATAPASTWTAFDIVQDADSNNVLESHLYNLAGPLAAANGWKFNSSSLTTNNDTLSWRISYFDSTSANITGCGITANQSSAMFISTQVLNWSGPNQFCLGAGATPSIDWQSLDNPNATYMVDPVVWGAAQPALQFSSSFNSGVFSSLEPASGFSNGITWTLPNVTGNVALTTGALTSGDGVKLDSSGRIVDTGAPSSAVVVEYCGASSGATQDCLKQLQSLPLIVFGDVMLNTATTQSITMLPFSDALYSCTGSDLTTAAGIVSFTTYASASVTIRESGGVNTDHLRYVCVGR